MFPMNAVLCSSFMWSKKRVNGYEHEQHETTDGQIQLTTQLSLLGAKY